MYLMLQGKNRAIYLWIALLGISNTILNGMLLFFFSNTISGSPFLFLKEKEYEWLIFIPMLLITLWVNKIFQTNVTKITYNILYDFDLELIRKLRFASTESILPFIRRQLVFLMDWPAGVQLYWKELPLVEMRSLCKWLNK